MTSTRYRQTQPSTRHQRRNRAATGPALVSLFQPGRAGDSAPGQPGQPPEDHGKGLVLASTSATEAAEVVQAVLVDDGPPQFGQLMADAVLDAYLRSGRLVPAPSGGARSLGMPGDAARAMARAQRLDELRAGAWADATLLGYGRAVDAWRRWCSQEGVPALPFHAEHVVSHLLDYAFEWDAESGDYRRAREGKGQLVARVAAGSVTLRLAGLNKAAEFIGIARPGDNAGVAEVMRGIRRAIGTAPSNRKAALDLEKLTRCLNATTGATYTAARSRALLLTRARASATTGQLARLTWPDVDLSEGGVVLHLAPTTRAGTGREVEVPCHANPSLCVAHALAALRSLSQHHSAWGAAVFAHPGGRALSRQAPYLAIERMSREAGGWQGLPDLSDRLLARLLEGECPRTPLATARDRALLLTGFYTASRRSNLTGLNWRDLTDCGADGWEVVHRRSKTDQEGRGRTLWVPERAGHISDCPANSLRDWHRALSAALGRQPAQDEPVFASMTAHGNPVLTSAGRLRRMTGEAVNEVVQRLTVSAGLAPATGPNPWGAHSLRAGFVTEALRDDKLTIPEVADVTGHASLDVLFTYRREVNAAKHNPARKLMSRLGKD